MNYYKILLFMAFAFFAVEGRAQCQGEFKSKAVSTEERTSDGKIELSTENAVAFYEFKLFRIDGEVRAVEAKNIISNDKKVIFEGLEVGDYIIRVQWGAGCTKNVGGIDGIKITAKTK